MLDLPQAGKWAPNQQVSGPPDGKLQGLSMKYGFSAISVAVGAFLALMAAALGQDEPFRIIMWIAFVVLSIGRLCYCVVFNLQRQAVHSWQMIHLAILMRSSAMEL